MSYSKLISLMAGAAASPGGGDPVQDFLTATGISDGTIEGALQDLYDDLLADGIWAKCEAIYPFVGGDATKHSFNFKDPTEHQITWSGTVTHNGNGITGNGSTGFGDTGLAANALTNNSTHLSIYCRTAGAGSNDNIIEIGCAVNHSSGNSFNLGVDYFNAVNCDMYSNTGVGGGNLFVAQANGAGFVVGSRRASNDFEVYKNGSSIGTTTSAVSGALPGINIYVGAQNSTSGGGAVTFSDRNIAFASIGSGLTDAEVANFHTRVEAFQDALSRGVV